MKVVDIWHRGDFDEFQSPCGEVVMKETAKAWEQKYKGFSPLAGKW